MWFLYSIDIYKQKNRTLLVNKMRKYLNFNDLIPPSIRISCNYFMIQSNSFLPI